MDKRLPISFNDRNTRFYRTPGCGGSWVRIYLRRLSLRRSGIEVGPDAHLRYRLSRLTRWLHHRQRPAPGSLTANAAETFTYSVQTNTVMTANDDGGGGGG